MLQLNPLRQLPNKFSFTDKDIIVIFGEVFSRGYVTGLIEEAERCGAKVIYSTVGRRDKDGTLRSLNNDELLEKHQAPLINIPLEAGFDMEVSESGMSPCEQLAPIKLKQWQEAKLDFNQIEQSKEKGTQRFKRSIAEWVEHVKKHIEPGANVLFVHTMAGGIPRAKIVMPAMNRVFKGHGDRFMSSQAMWLTDIGKLCDKSFEEVTANTYQHLIDGTKELRENITANGGRVRYTAYGYHGTELYIGDDLKWQSFSPYLQGFAKMKLEQIAVNASNNSIAASVFNAPEILTNSSSVFLGIEIALYQLLYSLRKQHSEAEKVKTLVDKCSNLLKDEHSLDDVFEACNGYFTSTIIQKDWSHYDKWPQHNGPEQMSLMHETSKSILAMHKSEKELLVAELSEIIFQACGYVMLHSGWDELKDAVYWVGHDVVMDWYIN